MIHLLKQLGYTPPTIVAGKYRQMEIIDNNGVYYMYIDGQQWMSYNTRTHEDAYSVYGHWLLAEGDVVVTGLGFGAREQWLLSKQAVKSLTIVEACSSVIDYHYQIKSPLINDPRVRIINMPAQQYTGKCDVLLLDHYETQTMEQIMIDAKNIHDRVECAIFWFWPFERIIMHSRKWMTDNDQSGRLYTKHDAFIMLKEHHQLSKMPDFDQDTINLLCMLHHSTVFSRSELFLQQHAPDRKLNHGMYVSI